MKKESQGEGKIGRARRRYKEKSWKRALLTLCVWQALLCALLEILPVLLLPPGISGIAYSVFMWGLLPLIGAFLSFRAVRGGLNYFVAWPFSPLLMTGIHWAALGYPPQSAGMPIVAALTALVAAAAAEEIEKRETAQTDVNRRK